jgi:peptidoglycan/xylan/chitin deacetylase (PgdA/CDA1 family)
LIEVGAHTVHHIALKQKFYPIVKYEVEQSKAWLESNYHLHVVSFAYPDGSFDEQAVNEVKSAGFSNAVSTIPGIEQNQQNRFFLYRLRPGYMVGQELLDYLNRNTFELYP